MKVFYLYKITNIVNNKLYIGATSRPSRRWIEHKSESSPCAKLKRAISKYGKSAFVFEIICVGSEDYIFNLESELIKAFDSIKNGYNIQSGGQRYHFTPETRITDAPVYVSGFWFQSDRQAYKTLGINKRTYFCRKQQGTLGNVKISTSPRIPRKRAFPVFVKGFWFPTNKIAQEVLGLSQPTISRLHRQSLNNIRS